MVGALRGRQEGKDVRRVVDGTWECRPVRGKAGPCVGKRGGWFDSADVEQHFMLVPKQPICPPTTRSSDQWLAPSPCIAMSIQPKSMKVCSCSTPEETIADTRTELEQHRMNSTRLE